MPACMVKDGYTLADKTAILIYLNEYFVSSGSLFESSHPHQSNVQQVCLQTLIINAMAPEFYLTPFDVVGVHRALQQLDLSKSTGPDNVDLNAFRCWSPLTISVRFL